MSAAEDETQVARLQFDTVLLLPKADLISVPLLRLLAATNDVILMQKHVIIAHSRSETAEELQKDVLNGELGYFIRTLCGHLYEAGTAFRALENVCKDQINRIMTANAKALEVFGTLREVYQDNSDAGFDHGVLRSIRNLTVFHYKDQTFAEGLDALKGNGEIILSEHIGFTRYVLTDEMLTKKVWDLLGGAEKYKEALKKAFDLADALAIAVTHILWDRLETSNVPVRETRGKLPIPPEIIRTRQRIETERTK